MNKMITTCLLAVATMGSTMAQTTYYEITDESAKTVSVVDPTAHGWGSITKPTGELTIPEKVTNADTEYSVTSIGLRALITCRDITSVSIPSSVTNIGSSAFENCRKLNSVTVAWETPIVIADNVFWGVMLNNATLIVPVGKIEVYKAAEGWKLFTQIVEDKPTAIHSPTTNAYKLHVQGKSIVVKNVKSEVLSVRVYNVTGTLLHTQTLQTTATISIPRSGTYIVQVGENTSKVLVP